MSTKTIKLSAGLEIDIKAGITWGDSQRIEASLMDGLKVGQTGIVDYKASAIIESKFKTIELMVVAVRQDEKVIPFSRDIIDNLSVEDGDMLYSEIEAVTKKKSEKAPGKQS